ncbi:type-F conjugative transfer system pilin assembly thiol-disulfide isomerase TrbB [Proteus mirabilis]|uniref:type-F conjugative transfer system pilin assembly thiol-disulfide isomerase TrbB n=1 Tax=Gammaproteobacteria TaxID=1236 RepID=UPI000E05CEDB|nr:MULTISPECIES: type-F conjugative transfer system pilin assembly thiol-disulfide isomerase TrbB [Gammaproteobacteria]ELA7740696.1 type-F conjugative transfer system pilin assembly thiol-disulfide isomerase TrbB [Proteus mirabilis]MBG2905368.1 type-F conjugative transfer system pilin assembly thiol-disulfide isomerase TrbB [Proteus mirabilis]MBG3156678.1 type-F conjugative transfer system pilin assembly thiol-disulfide isomerase TrbB [Proteus mirabilis]MBG5994282.1 type-F conjugative transfer 
MNKIVIVLGFFFSSFSYSSTLDEIKQLEINKNFKNNYSVQVESREKNFIQLSTGKEINISDWQIVHFIKSDCPYCHQFNPTLKEIADSIKLPVFVYSFDGKGDSTFPVAYPVNNEIIRTFFAEIPQATPTSFLINVNTLITVPLSQGAVSANSLLQRLDESFILIDKLQNEQGVIE